MLLEAGVDEAPFQLLARVGDVAQVQQRVEHVFRRQPGLAVAQQLAHLVRIALAVLVGIPDEGGDVEFELRVVAVEGQVAAAVIQGLAMVGHVHQRPQLPGLLEGGDGLGQEPVRVQDGVVVAVVELGLDLGVRVDRLVDPEQGWLPFVEGLRIALAVIPVVAQRVQHDQFFRRRVGHGPLQRLQQHGVEIGAVGKAAQVEELDHVRFLGEHGDGRVELAERNLVRQPPGLEARFLVGRQERFFGEAILQALHGRLARDDDGHRQPGGRHGRDHVRQRHQVGFLLEQRIGGARIAVQAPAVVARRFADHQHHDLRFLARRGLVGLEPETAAALTELGQVAPFLPEVGAARGQAERPAGGEGVAVHGRAGPVGQGGQLPLQVAGRRHGRQRRAAVLVRILFLVVAGAVAEAGGGHAGRRRVRGRHGRGGRVGWGARGGRRLGLDAEFVAPAPHGRQQQQGRQRAPAAAPAPVQGPAAHGHYLGQQPPGQHGRHGAAQQPHFLAQKFHRLARAGLGDDAQVVGGDALAVEHEQVDLGRQGDKGGQQQPVEPGRALEHGPRGEPAQRLDGADLPRLLDGLAQQPRHIRDGRQQQIGGKQEQVGRTQQGSHKDGE